MGLTRKTLLIALCVLAVWYAWTSVGASATRTVTLTVADEDHNETHFARVWVVEDRPYLWIRAERPDRSWLGPAREGHIVTLSDGRERARYVPTVWDDDESREFVSELFREKYGVVDRVRSALFIRHSVPVRLTRLADDIGSLGRR
jgi:hypothetical protein